MLWVPVFRQWLLNNLQKRILISGEGTSTIAFKFHAGQFWFLLIWWHPHWDASEFMRKGWNHQYFVSKWWCCSTICEVWSWAAEKWERKKYSINEYKRGKSPKLHREVAFQLCKSVPCILSDSLCPLSHRVRENYKCCNYSKHHFLEVHCCSASFKVPKSFLGKWRKDKTIETRRRRRRGAGKDTRTL